VMLSVVRITMTTRSWYEQRTKHATSA
jgi:hypothetical protein